MKYATRAAPAPTGEPDKFVLSDASVDRVGDVIEQNWDLANFGRNPIALFNHDRNQIVGEWADVKVEANRLTGKLVLADEGTNPLVDSIRRLRSQGILRAVSVGFIPLRQEPLTADASEYFGPFRYLKSELIEASLVSVPANPNAVQLARSLNLQPEIIATLFRVNASEDMAPALVPNRRVSQIPRSIASSVMRLQGTLGQRIQTAQQNLIALTGRLKELSEQEQQTEEEARRASEIPTEMTAAETTLNDLLAQERALGRRNGSVAATPRAPDPAASEQRTASGTEVTVYRGEGTEPRRTEPSREVERRPFGADSFAGKQKIDPSDYVFRSLATWLSSVASREPLENVLRTRYGDRDENLNMVLRAAVNPAMTTVAGWAAELAQTVNAGFINRLLFKSIYQPLSNRGQRYTFPSGVSQLKIPVRTNTNLLTGVWVGEGAPKPVKRASFSSVPLVPHKLAVISTFTEEMALYSNPAIEAIIRQGLQDDTQQSLDAYLIDGTASSSIRPAGLLNSVVPITAASTGTALEKMVADLKALVQAMVATGGGQDPVILLNPAQAFALGFAQTTTGEFLFASVVEAGQKFNCSFIVSQNVPIGTVVAVDAYEFATATGDTPRLAISNEATLHEEDTTPLAIGTPGAPATVAAPVRSLFQTDSIAIRLTLYVSWVMRRPGMVQWIATVGW